MKQILLLQCFLRRVRGSGRVAIFHLCCISIPVATHGKLQSFYCPGFFFRASITLATCMVIVLAPLVRFIRVMLLIKARPIAMKFMPGGNRNICLLGNNKFCAIKEKFHPAQFSSSISHLWSGNAFTTSPLLSVIMVEYSGGAGRGKIQFRKKNMMTSITIPIPVRFKTARLLFCYPPISWVETIWYCRIQKGLNKYLQR